MDTPKLHLIENGGLKAYQKQVKRLKARHLSMLTRRIICDKFAAFESCDDVIREMDMPGLTRAVIFEVLHSMQIRKGPASAEKSVAQFRMAQGAR